jgi:LacI family transcriptional regulator
MTTIKQVAEHAGVSVATVSRVINKTGFVSPDLEERVVEAMRLLNYQPSALARGLRAQRTQTIGVLIPQLDQPFFSALTYAIEQFMFTQDYRTLICSAEEIPEKETSYVDMLLRQRIDGAMIVPMGHSGENVQRLLERQVPVVMLDRDLPGLDGVHRVLVNNESGAYEAVRYLISQGHRRIGLVGSPEYSEPVNHRFRGARRALADAGIEIDQRLIINGDLKQFEMGSVAGRKLLRLEKPPTAIFALTDVMAVGVIHAALQLGLKLPQDCSVIGFDNIPLASYITPELTTVAQPIYELGETASRLLLDAMRETTPAQRVYMDTRLVLRQSVTSIKP